jgi:hypothetical protein
MPDYYIRFGFALGGFGLVSLVSAFHAGEGGEGELELYGMHE